MTRHLFIADRVRTRSGVVGDSVLVEDGRIVSAGWWRKMNTEGIEVTRFPGATIVPGFRDAHLHPIGLTAAITGLDLSDITDFADLRDRVRRWAGHLPPHAAVMGTGIDDERLLEGRMPTRHDLDGILAARPILLYRHCSHIATANTVALARAGIDDSTPDPPDGRLGRTARGALTGILEETAIALVSGVLSTDIPGPDAGSVARTLDDLAAVGITDIDAIVSAGTPMWCGSGNELDLLLEAAERPTQRIRVFVAATTPIELRTMAGRITAGGLVFGGWKGFADGSLGGHTALLRTPYADTPGTVGVDRWHPTTMRAMAETALELDGQVAIHAIGDAALERVVELAESIRPPAGSIRAEHASIAPPDLLDRMARAGVVASVQPQFVESDAPWLTRRLGPVRSAHAYPFASMLAGGLTVVAGSDAPIERPDPLRSIRAARERAGFQETEALDLDQALAIHSAHHMVPGDPADLTVIAPDVGHDDASVVAIVTGGSAGAQPDRWGPMSDS